MIRLLRKLRHLYLLKIRWRNFTFGKNVYIGRSVYIWAKHMVSIGDNFYIGKYSQIECDSAIGNNVMFGNFVALIGRHDHNFNKIGIPTRLAGSIRDKDFDGQGISEKTIINDDVWIGHGSIILSGVTIGQGSIIGAGSVVTKDVEPFSIYAGNPAVKIKPRFNNDNEMLEHKRLYKLNF